MKVSFFVACAALATVKAAGSYDDQLCQCIAENESQSDCIDLVTEACNEEFENYQDVCVPCAQDEKSQECQDEIQKFADTCPEPTPAPTMSPLPAGETRSPTNSPTKAPTGSPTKAPTGSPVTEGPTPTPSDGEFTGEWLILEPTFDYNCGLILIEGAQLFVDIAELDIVETDGEVEMKSKPLKPFGCSGPDRNDYLTEEDCEKDNNDENGRVREWGPHPEYDLSGTFDGESGDINVFYTTEVQGCKATATVIGNYNGAEQWNAVVSLQFEGDSCSFAGCQDEKRPLLGYRRGSEKPDKPATFAPTFVATTLSPTMAPTVVTSTTTAPINSADSFSASGLSLVSGLVVAFITYFM